MDLLDLLDQAEKDWYESIQMIVDFRSHTGEYLVKLPDGTKRWETLPEEMECVTAYKSLLAEFQEKTKDDPDIAVLTPEDIDEWQQCPYLKDPQQNLEDPEGGQNQNAAQVNKESEEKKEDENENNENADDTADDDIDML